MPVPTTDTTAAPSSAPSLAARCVLIGSGTLPLRCGEILLGDGHEICGLISGDDQVTQWARSRGIPVWQGDDIAGLLRQEPFDYLFSIVNEHILTAEALGIPAKGAINYHDGPLPRYAGTHATSWALLNGETTHGITWHAIAAAVDAGDIIKQRIIAIDGDDTAFSLNVRCYEAAVESFAEISAELAQDRIAATPQRIENRTFYPRYKRWPAASILRWDASSARISAIVRAHDLGPYPNPLGLARLSLGGVLLAVQEVAAETRSTAEAPGTIIGIDAAAITVATGDGTVALQRLRTLEGALLTIPEVVTRFGLTVGGTLPELSDDLADRFSVLNAVATRHEDFWAERLATVQPVVIPAARPPAGITAVEPEGKRFKALPIQLPVSMHPSTAPELLIAGFCACLARITGLDRFDLSLSGAELRAEVNGLEALFAAAVPLRVSAAEDSAVEMIAADLARELAMVRRRHTYPHDLPLRYPALRACLDSHRLPVLPVGVEIGSASTNAADCPGRQLTFVVSGGSRDCCLVYDTEALDAADATRVRDMVERLLAHVVAHPSTTVGTLPLIDQAERRLLVTELNATQQEYGEVPPVHASFALQAARKPDAVAVVGDTGVLTYRELAVKARQIAAELRRRGVGPGALVGIYLQRSVEKIAALLGVLEAGGAYVPLDPDYPRDRLAFMVADSGLSVLLTQAALRDTAPEAASVLCLEEVGAEDSGAAPGATLDDLAYVIYTSGSTGKPKGVMVPHGALAVHCRDLRRFYGISESDRILQFASINFDTSVEQIFIALVSGATLVVRGQDVWTAHECFQRLVRHGITVADFTTSYWHQLVHAAQHGASSLAGHRLRLVLVGGEAMLPSALACWQQTALRSVRLLNVYGPTETTVTATAYEASEHPADAHQGRQAVPIGRPLGNRTAYVLDSRKRLVPFGLPGELYLGGAGLARGYLNRPDLTADRFTPDPFSNGPGARLYRTGDTVRYLPDGNLEFLGRLDDQIKIRGFRIELGEIEEAISQYSGVHQAAVLVDDRDGDRRLVAYVAADRASEAADRLRRFLSSRLPPFMIPAAFIFLDALPLTPNGKVDRRALAALEHSREEWTDSAAPRTATERIVLEAWREALRDQRLGIHDNFFDAGGHSLLAMELLARITARFDVDLSLHVLFGAPTVESLARHIDRRTGVAEPIGPNVGDREGSPRTATEQRLAAIWERLAATGPVGIRDNLLAIQNGPQFVGSLFSEVKAAFGFYAEGLPIGRFTDEPTIEALARMIDGNIAESTSLVVPLQPHGTRRPLFLIHAGGGYVFFYRALAMRLGIEQPVYAVRAETQMDRLGTPFDACPSVEALAAQYIAHIRTIQASGPYAIGGGCFGGLVAFEIARQLLEQGEQLATPVLLFDSIVCNNVRSTSRRAHSKWRYVLARFADHRRRMTTLDGAAAMRYAARTIVWNAFMLPVDIGRTVRNRVVRNRARLSQEKAWRSLIAAGMRAPSQELHARMVEQFMLVTDRLVDAYVPQPLPASLALFRNAREENPEPLWEGLAKGGLTVHECPGGHLEMFEEPLVAATAAEVSRYLERGQLAAVREERVADTFSTSTVATMLSMLLSMA
jgi:amino acid adenylation domain-containing protein